MVVSFMNEKGGVGKSSLTFSCAWHLAEQGKKVLLIDMDGQMANLTYLSGLVTDAQSRTMADVLLRGWDIGEAVLNLPESPGGNLSLIPATVSMADTLAAAKVSRMKKVIRQVSGDYDYVFLDVNPSPDWKHALTLSVLDAVCVVMLPDVLSLEANRGIIDSIEEVQEGINPGLKTAGFVFNLYDGRTNLSREVLKKADAMAEYMGTSVFEAKLRKAVVMGESAFAHKGITGYAPSSGIAEDVRAFTKEFESRVQEVGA